MVAVAAFALMATLPTLAGAAGTTRVSAATEQAMRAQPVQFEVFLPLRNTTELDKLLADQQTEGSPNYHKWLNPTEFGARFGPTKESVAKVQAALAASGLRVTEVGTRSLKVEGAVPMVERTFTTGLKAVSRKAGTAELISTTPLALPTALAQEGVVIPAFANLPLKHSFAKRVNATFPASRRGPVGGYYYNDLKQAYDYPAYRPGKGAFTGRGVSVAVLMENDALDSDIKAMFDHENFTATTGKPAPTINHYTINGGAPFDVNASFEASLDVQQVLGGAPDATVSLINIPNLSDNNLLAGYNSIVQSNAFDIVNSSFGGCEKLYSKQYNNGTDYSGILDVFDTLFKQGNAQGITFVASSGDEGGLECPQASVFTGGPARFVRGISSPASSPNVTAVGGGNLVTTDLYPALTSKYVRENGIGDPEIPYDIYGTGVEVSGGYWGAGGGTSYHFPIPDYQKLVPTGSPKFRAVPDVGMMVGGCPGLASSCIDDESFAIIWVGGNRYGVIGTSVSSPEFVGAVALYIQKQKHRVGNLNPYLYQMAALQNASTAPQGTNDYYHRPMEGFDGAYRIKTGQKFNYIFGNGSPDVRALFGFQNQEPAGDPQTPTNP